MQVAVTRTEYNLHVSEEQLYPIKVNVLKIIPQSLKFQKIFVIPIENRA